MAILGTIRKNFWLVVVLLGMALASFVLMDMVGAGNRNASVDTSMGEVGGSSIDYREFQNMEQALYSGSSSSADVYARRNYLWNFFVEKAIVEQESEKLGFVVSDNELEELEFGPNYSPIIQQRFTDPATGRMDPVQLNNFRQQYETDQLQPNQRAFWEIQKNEIKKESLKSKLVNLVGKGMYVPTWQLQADHNDLNEKVEFDYVRIPYSDVSDSDAMLTDADYKAYYDENKEAFYSPDERRAVDYVVFNVVPSSEDSTGIFNEMTEIKTEFSTSEDDSLFVLNNTGVMDEAYFLRDKLTPLVADSIFEKEVGSLVGPFEEDGDYKVIKLVDKKIVPDSVESRHILFKFTTQEEYLSALQRADSIQVAIEDGSTTFADMATQFGTDATATKGGDLGYTSAGGMVKPFNDLIFYKAEKNKIYKVFTQFGLHLVEVTGQKFIENEDGVKLAILSIPIIPGDETVNIAYEKAMTFISANRTLVDLRNNIGNYPELAIESSAPFKASDYNISGLGIADASRQIVKSSFEPSAELEDVFPEAFAFEDEELFYTNKYVVAALSKIMDAGYQNLEEIKESIADRVMQQKKANYFNEAHKGSNLESIAASVGATVGSASELSLRNAYIQDAGNEPVVLGNVYKQEVGQMSDAIAGTNGIYFIVPTNKTEAGELFNAPFQRQQTSNSERSRVIGSLLPAIEKAMDVEDDRSRYF